MEVEPHTLVGLPHRSPYAIILQYIKAARATLVVVSELGKAIAHAEAKSSC